MTTSRLPLLLALLLAGSALALPHFAHAAIPFWGPIIPAGNLQECAIGWAGLIIVANNIINLALTITVAFIAPLVFAYGGFLYLTSGENPGQRSQANTMMLNLVVGIVVALAAWLIVDAVLGVLYNASAGGGPWYSLITSGGQDPCIPLKSSLAPSGGATQAPGGLTAANSGSNSCAGNLICGSNDTCQIDPSVDNTDGSAGQPCNVANPMCQSGLTCDNTGTCSASGTTNGIPAGDTCTPLASGGSCTNQNSGPCASSNMGVFGAAADQASEICYAESSGNPSNPGDIIVGGPSAGQAVSFGLFQINISANDVNNLGCPSAFDRPYTGSHENVVIENQSLYASCKAAAIDPNTNIQTAYGIYMKDNDSFREWTTAGKCGIAFLNSAPLVAQACAIMNSYD